MNLPGVAVGALGDVAKACVIVCLASSCCMQACSDSPISCLIRMNSSMSRMMTHMAELKRRTYSMQQTAFCMQNKAQDGDEEAIQIENTFYEALTAVIGHGGILNSRNVA